MNRNAAITQSYATGGVIGKDKVGGLVGYTDVHGTIMQAYATGSVSGINSNVGGLVGNNFLGTMTQAYATGSVSGLDNAGGLVGYNAGTITQSYVTGGVSTQNSVGGLVGYDGGSAVTDSYWDIETSGQSSGVGGTGLTTAEARQASSYAGWDFTNVWFQSGDMRLILRSEAATPVNGVTTITNLHQLALVGANLSGSYVLGANIDASASAGADAAGIRSAKGFVPIGPAYATGAISGGNIVGGLIGQNYGAANQAYASGSVSGGGAVGGVIGQNYEAVDQAYATGAVSASGSQGGLIGDNYVTVTSSYLDTQTSGLVNGVGSGSSSGATGLTTARMRNPFTFIDTGWNFANIWATPKAGGAPLLRSLVIDPSYDYYIRLSGNMSATYGDTIGTSGIARAGVGVGNVSVGWGSAISATTNVGNYAYGDSNVLALTYSAGVAGDYYLDFGADALSVAQRAITVTADAQSKTYGNANAALTNTVGGSGLVNNDTLSGSLSTMGASSPMSASMG